MCHLASLDWQIGSRLCASLRTPQPVLIAGKCIWGTEKRRAETGDMAYKHLQRDDEAGYKNPGSMSTDGQGDTWRKYITNSKFLAAYEHSICISGRKEDDSVPLITIIDAELKNSR